jgi:hypothetical protein
MYITYDVYRPVVDAGITIAVLLVKKIITLNKQILNRIYNPGSPLEIHPFSKYADDIANFY